MAWHASRFTALIKLMTGPGVEPELQAQTRPHHSMPQPCQINQSAYYDSTIMRIRQQLPLQQLLLHAAGLCCFQIRGSTLRQACGNVEIGYA
jgi:hypothetical protein